MSKVTLRTSKLTDGAPVRRADSIDDIRSAGRSANGSLDEDGLLRALLKAEKGDFSVRLPKGGPRGTGGKIAAAFNGIMDRNARMAKEFERISMVVGREGKLTQRASLKGAEGSWAGSVDSINTLLDGLSQPTQEIVRVITAVANGDLSQSMPLEIKGTPIKGELLQAAKSINTMVEQLRSFTAEVTRVAKEVGTDGKLGGQAKVKGVSGAWNDLVSNVNVMARNLTNQVRNIAEVTTAVANGDLSRKITVTAKGEVLKLKNTINKMVDQLNSFSSEVTRVAREVGTEGKLGGQARVRGARGTWKDLTDNVNGMARNLTNQVRDIAQVTAAVASGNLTKTITAEASGEILELKNTINTMTEQLSTFAEEVSRVAREVGTDGKLGGQAQVKGVSGTWKDLTNNVNMMVSNLTDQVRDIAQVTTAVAQGDLSRKVTVQPRGEILEFKNTINTMVDQLSSFASEVIRIAQEVGTDGKLGGQAQVKGVSGTWKDLTDKVNTMAANLTDQVRNIAEVSTAITQGDLSKKITVEAKGETLLLKETINNMVDQLRVFAAEVTRLALEVGTEGRLGGQADVKGVEGAWRELTDNVNTMTRNLTDQIRNIAEVTTAVANGDLTKKVTVEVKGEILLLKNTINTMVDRLNSFSSQVTRVALEIGTEGKLGGQAEVEGVSGVWKELTGNVNRMANSLTEQVRNIAEVTTAVANGDFSKKITVDVRGEVLELKETINEMVEQLRNFSSEVTRVATEVGTEGRLGGQAQVTGVAGAWRDLTNTVNEMARNLTDQVRNVAEVTTAVANGDLTKKITVEARGEILQLKETINTMVDQLKRFASEVTRIATEVGTEGKLGGQADVEGVTGAWKELTDNVNGMASSLTEQVRDIAQVTTAVANGDLSKKITVEVRGEILELKSTINTMVDRLTSFASEVSRVALEVGTDGKLGGQAEVKGVTGTWKELTETVNVMASNLTDQVRDIAIVTTAVADGDLTKKITVEAKGEILTLKNTINTMIDRLTSFASEVTRVATEVGTDGKLGGQADVKGVEGAWRDLTDTVNTMAKNLTGQVRNIADVTTAVAKGDLTRKIEVEAKGEVAQLKDTINNMTETLGIFAEQVTGVAREVGVEGKLGGSADVPGAEGTWRDLTDNVNLLAGNLTEQVRAIANVSTAVTKGDYSQEITVEAKGEVGELRDTTNEMIRTLASTTETNSQQDWLKTNLAKFSSMMQGRKDVEAVSKQILSDLAPLIDARHAVFYILETDDTDEKKQALKLRASYAYKQRKNLSDQFKIGEGLVGQCAQEKQRILLTKVPSDYIQINSGLGESVPLNITVLPVLFEGQVTGVIELASFKPFTEIQMTFLDQLTENIGITLNTITAANKTEELLKEQQTLTEELQTQSEELQQSNEELEEKSKVLGEQKIQVEAKNKEIEIAGQGLAEKAEQLALTSKYKSEFLANMSHELRTPLNSVLILSRSLADNPDENLTPKQVESSETIYSSGSDLLGLINEILDLAKIESGTMAVEAGEIRFKDLQGHIDRNFTHVAQEKQLGFEVTVDSKLPQSIFTDEKRLHQVLRNLLSNALKFTRKGQVTAKIEVAAGGWSFDHKILNDADTVVAFSVTDTGIGIPKDKLNLVFEAFQQADGGTSRRYGGTGLGLSISREIARLLGGEIRLKSEPGKGSTFTFYLPLRYTVSHRLARAQARVRPEEIETQAEEVRRPAVRVEVEVPKAEVDDDRDDIEEGDRILLIIEDDIRFAKVVLDMAREKKFKGLVATTGASGLALARRYNPDAITLDIKLPDMEGWVVLDRLKHDSNTRHIPVHILSVEDEPQRGLSMGAVAHLRKPIEKDALSDALAQIADLAGRKGSKLLVVEDDEVQRKGVVELIGNSDVSTTAVGTAKEAIQALKKEKFDCMVLDLRLPDMSGFDLMDKIKKDLKLSDLPIIVYTGKDLTKKEETRLTQMARTIIVKGVMSLERLLDETALFLHRVESKLPESKRKMIKQAQRIDPVVSGKKVLIVDDDVRNIYATTTILEPHNMNVVYAENGKEGIEMLQKTAGIDIALMDIMMPEMDGYEAMRRIRNIPEFEKLPIIALTAKAMKGDREKCLEAGASDYISKPVDPQQLLSLLRVWLYQK